MAMKQYTVKESTGYYRIRFKCSHCGMVHCNHPSDGVCRRCGKV